MSDADNTPDIEEFVEKLQDLLGVGHDTTRQQVENCADALVESLQEGGKEMEHKINDITKQCAEVIAGSSSVHVAGLVMNIMINMMLTMYDNNAEEDFDEDDARTFNAAVSLLTDCAFRAALHERKDDAA